jgi:hypothetical protein
MAEQKTVQEWAEATNEAFAVAHYGKISFDEAKTKFAAEKAEADKKAQADRIAELEAANAKMKTEFDAKIAELSKAKTEADAKIAALSSGAPPVPFAEGKDTAKGKLPLSSLFSKKS